MASTTLASLLRTRMITVAALVLLIGAHTNPASATRPPVSFPAPASSDELPDVATAPPRQAQAHADREPATPPTKHNATGKVERAEKKTEVGEAGANATSNDYMTPHGGYVQTAPRVYLLFWGNSFWTYQDYYHVRDRLEAFYKGVGGSVWASQMKEYSGAGGAFTNPSAVLKGSAFDSTVVPAHPTQNQVQDAAIRARRYFNDWGYNTQFIVVLPSGHIDQTSQLGACGWHYWGNDNGYGFTFTSLPYTPDFGNACGNYLVNNSILDGTTIVASHEFGETVTDPYGNGWQDSTGITGENGDKCNRLYPANAHYSNGAFPVQSLWSNYYKRYYLNGCLYPSGY